MVSNPPPPAVLPENAEPETISKPPEDTVNPMGTRIALDRAQNDPNPSTIGSTTTKTPFPTTESPPELPPPHARPRPRSDGLTEPEPNTGRGFRPRKAAGFYKNLNNAKESANLTAGEEFAGLTEFHKLIALEMKECEVNGTEESYLEDMGEEFGMGATGDDVEPRTVWEALASPDKEGWRLAIEDELNQIEKLRTWDIVEAPKGANIVKSGFIFKCKRDEDNFIVRLRA
jgi:hypothetical protein